MHPEDRRFQRLLWRRREDEVTSDYELNTVTYDLACAPYLVIRTLRQLVQDERSRFPWAATILEMDVYMDDVLTGADGEEEAREIQEELRLPRRAGGFNLRKWVSNAPTLAEGAPRRRGPIGPSTGRKAHSTRLWASIGTCARTSPRVRVAEDHATPSGYTSHSPLPHRSDLRPSGISDAGNYNSKDIFTITLAVENRLGHHATASGWTRVDPISSGPAEPGRGPRATLARTSP